MKFTTPVAISDYFYFNIDFRDMMTKLNDECEEIIGFSIGRVYIGFYGNSINWGILDENGSLWEVAQGGLRNPPIRSTLHSFLKNAHVWWTLVRDSRCSWWDLW
jgi:hypothetical protein